MASGQTFSDSNESIADEVLGAAANGVGALETSVEQAETGDADAPAAEGPGLAGPVKTRKVHPCPSSSLTPNS